MPAKKLGQVFLKDQNLIRKIVTSAQIVPEHSLVEIGCGEGVMSALIAAQAKDFTIIEIDQKYLLETQKRLVEFKNVNYVHADVLKSKFTAVVNKPYKIVANIPYYISAKIIKLIIEQRSDIIDAVIMVQKEFGEKLTAKPGSKLYTSLNVYTNFYMKIESLFLVSRHAFRPVPKVDSIVLKLTPREKPLFEVDEALFFNLVRSAFWGRRKKLINCIQKAPYLTVGSDILNIPFFQKNPNIRGELLSIADYYLLYTQLTERCLISIKK